MPLIATSLVDWLRSGDFRGFLEGGAGDLAGDLGDDGVPLPIFSKFAKPAKGLPCDTPIFAIIW